MAAIVSSGAGAGVDLELLASELALRLPQYARPLFVRLVDAIDDTGTQRSRLLVRVTALRDE